MFIPMSLAEAILRGGFFKRMYGRQVFLSSKMPDNGYVVTYVDPNGNRQIKQFDANELLGEYSPCKPDGNPPEEQAVSPVVGTTDVPARVGSEDTPPSMPD